MNRPPAFVMETVSDLWDHIAYVMEYAPSGFPLEDYLLPEQQMNLDMAFQQLHQGVAIAYPASSAAAQREQLDALLDRALAEYRNGDKTVAAGMLAEFESIIFTPDGRQRGAT
jgi:exonuclease VII small subunit